MEELVFKDAEEKLLDRFRDPADRLKFVVVTSKLLTGFDAPNNLMRDKFDGWQTTTQGERDVQQALRRALFKCKLHTDQELFEKAYGYIRQY